MRNSLGELLSTRRVVLTVGNFSTLDVFDDNAYAKDPRAQFMNWSHWTYAAFDYAADAPRQLVGDAAPLVAGRLGIVLGEGGGDEG